ncbi:BTAD domain-containing putative transcriptional regulator [Nonomuraea sp. NPDC050556]|uniref:AfsR/SARP family transcriptional regulator n=1 Tax=Nonomuraea sp. NPDC050556 TaxID=3364369 RepID=UPI00379DE134
MLPRGDVVHVRLLGPVEVLVGTRRLQLPGPRPTVILSMLALEPNRVVSNERLTEAIWDDDPPSTAKGQIQFCVSALRRMLAEAGLSEVIVTRAPGYVLDIPADSVDAQVFDREVARGRALAESGKLEEAAASLRAALDMWYGTALDGIPGRVVRGSAHQLEERRLAAVEERMRLELALGRHGELVGDLTALVQEHPLRETLHAHLMVALHRAGRQAEALETYRRARATLVEELGIEPGEELRALEQAILRGEGRVGPAPAREGPAPAHETPGWMQVVPRQLPAAIADYTGRAEHVTDMVGALTAMEGPSRSVPVIVISGQGGVGKSSLAVQVAHTVREHFADGQLYAELRGGNGQPVAALEILERFLRALGVAGIAIPDGLDARAEMYRSRLGDQRMLVVLDDAMSEAQVTPLLPGSSTCAVLVTSRTRLTGLPGAHRVELGTLDKDQAITLLERIIGERRVREEPAEAALLAKLCGNLPLALRIAGAKLASRPHWQLRQLAARLDDENRRLDELEHGDLGIRASIELSYQGLAPPAKRLLRLLAVLETPDVPSWVGAALLDERLAEAEDLLEELVDAQLVEAGTAGRSKGAPRYRMHELVRAFARGRALAEESAHDRGASLRRALTAWLALAGDAHRRAYGGDYTILHSDEPLWPPPAALADRLLANPMAWLEGEHAALVSGVRQAAALGCDDLCWDLALTAVTLFEAKSYFDDWRSTTELALSAVRRAGNSRGTAATLYSLGSLRLFDLQPDAATEALEPALALFTELGDRHGCALVLRNLAFIDSLRGDDAEALRKYEESLRVFRAVGDRTSEAHVLSNMARSLLDQGEYGKAEELLETALRISRDTGSRRLEAQVLYRVGETALQQDQLDKAGNAFTWVLRIVRDGGDRIGESYALYGLGRVYNREGRYEQAYTILDQALAVSCRIGERLVEGRVRYEQGEVELARRHPAEGVVRLEEAAKIFRDLHLPVWQALALVVLTEAKEADDPADADRIAAEAWRLLEGLDSVEAKRLRDRLSLHRYVPPGR